MLTITIPAIKEEWWDEKNEEFVYHTEGKDQVLKLEHSLISLYKWESKWCKSFLQSEKTDEEMLDYIKCMTLNSNVSDDVYGRLTPQNILQINDYINAPMTATTFRKTNQKPSRDIITSEIIYYWMISCRIPIEWEKRHLNQLMTLIRVFEAKDAPPQKHSQRELASQYAKINAANRKKYKTKG